MSQYSALRESSSGKGIWASMNPFPVKIHCGLRKRCLYLYVQSRKVELRYTDLENNVYREGLLKVQVHYIVGWNPYIAYACTKSPGFCTCRSPGLFWFGFGFVCFCSFPWKHQNFQNIREVPRQNWGPCNPKLKASLQETVRKWGTEGQLETEWPPEPLIWVSV